MNDFNEHDDNICGDETMQLTNLMIFYLLHKTTWDTSERKTWIVLL